MRLTSIISLCIILAMTASCLVACDDDTELAAADVPYTGMPQLYVSTPGNERVKRQYVDDCVLQVGNRGPLPSLDGKIMIKGRGNSSWIYPKKPYAFVTMSNGQTSPYQGQTQWVLLANYEDVTLMRNDIAMFMGREMSLLDYTPQGWFVDFSLNGSYQGIYYLCEGIEVGDDRVPAGDGGFLIEVDGKYKYHDVTFATSRLTHPINIHYPTVAEGDDMYMYVRNFVQTAEDALFADDFTDPETGYKRYIDIDSFVEWYIINEVAKNIDAAFYTSCFMHKSKDGKLMMGPLWDFGMGFGGYKDNEQGRTVANVPEGFYLNNARWIGRMLQDPAFVARLKQRFTDYYGRRQLIMDRIESDFDLIQGKAAYDNMLWGQLCDKGAPDDKVRAALRDQTDSLKAWIENRLAWLKRNIDAL